MPKGLKNFSPLHGPIAKRINQINLGKFDGYLASSKFLFSFNLFGVELVVHLQICDFKRTSYSGIR